MISGKQPVQALTAPGAMRPGQHDADHATFHRVRDFRRLALNLVPEL
jgi:hypothetical protein